MNSTLHWYQRNSRAKQVLPAVLIPQVQVGLQVQMEPMCLAQRSPMIYPHCLLLMGHITLIQTTIVTMVRRIAQQRSVHIPQAVLTVIMIPALITLITIQMAMEVMELVKATEAMGTVMEAVGTMGTMDQVETMGSTEGTIPKEIVIMETMEIMGKIILEEIMETEIMEMEITITEAMELTMVTIVTMALIVVMIMVILMVMATAITTAMEMVTVMEIVRTIIVMEGTVMTVMYMVVMVETVDHIAGGMDQTEMAMKMLKESFIRKIRTQRATTILLLEQVPVVPPAQPLLLAPAHPTPTITITKDINIKTTEENQSIRKEVIPSVLTRHWIWVVAPHRKSITSITSFAAPVDLDYLFSLVFWT